MYSVDIDFQTEKERVQLTRAHFATPEAASCFALEFIKPYIEQCAVADGEWKVYEAKRPEFVARHYPIKSVMSQRTEAKLF